MLPHGDARRASSRSAQAAVSARHSRFWPPELVALVLGTIALVRPLAWDGRRAFAPTRSKHVRERYLRRCAVGWVVNWRRPPRAVQREPPAGIGLLPLVPPRPPARAGTVRRAAQAQWRTGRPSPGSRRSRSRRTASAVGIDLTPSRCRTRRMELARSLRRPSRLPFSLCRTALVPGHGASRRVAAIGRPHRSIRRRREERREHRRRARRWRAARRSRPPRFIAVFTEPTTRLVGQPRPVMPVLRGIGRRSKACSKAHSAVLRTHVQPIELAQAREGDGRPPQRVGLEVCV